MNITIDKDIHDFLIYLYFGSVVDPYEAASNRAYLDMNRTIRYCGLDDSVRLELRQSVTTLLKGEIEHLSIHSQEEYDAWHYQTSTKMKEIYAKQGIAFTYGHAQKWINMMMKYLYVLGARDFTELFGYLHVPVDNYIFDAVKKELGIKRSKECWSSWDDYEGQYMDYQRKIREKVDVDPLRWEFKNWLKEASK